MFQRGEPARPRFVVITMTPFAASVPYSVAADGPFTISTFSISSGFRSPTRLALLPPVPNAATEVARHADAVDHVDRIVRETERALAADTNAGTGAGLRAGLHRDASRARVDHVIDAADRRLRRDLRRIDLGDGVALFHGALLDRWRS